MTIAPSTTGILPVSRPGRPWYECALAFVMSMSFTIWYVFAVGRNLGLFFAGLILATILAPILINGRHAIWQSISIVVAIALIWLSCIFNDAITFSEWFRATLVLLFYALAISGLAALLARFHIPPAAIVVLAIAWLSWPIWLAPWLRGESSEHTVALLVAGNPTFAIQGALWHSFPVPWAQHRIAYRLTNIGDDISYTMPTSIARSLSYHGIVAIIAWFAALAPVRPAHPPADQSPKST